MSKHESADSRRREGLTRGSSDTREMPESLRGINHADVDRLGEVIVEPDDAVLMDLERAEEAAHAKIVEDSQDSV